MSLGTVWETNSLLRTLYEGGRPSEAPGAPAALLPTNAVALAHVIPGTCADDTALARRRKWLEAVKKVDCKRIKERLEDLL